MLNLKYDTSECIYETETDSQIQRSDLRLPREKQVRIGNKHILLYIEWINKALLDNTGNFIQYFVVIDKGKESEIIYIYIYRLNHCAVHLKLT